MAKYFIDHNLPPRLAHAIRELCSYDKSSEIYALTDKFSAKAKDVDWITSLGGCRKTLVPAFTPVIPNFILVIPNFILVIPDFILVIPDFILVIPAKAGIHTDSPPEPYCPVLPWPCHPREGRDPPLALDSRLRGNDDFRG
ncbi:hypothetical protein [Endozoicomonas sp. ALC020]|uniref:PIN-like domain-containing protein n=1 Tax=unclassified Endozoicomonas TaxID=2644528 RepID=UPI003BAF738A